MLEPTKEEIEAAKKDLASITKQVFKFMASMYVTRKQLKHVSAATIHLKNKESKIGAKVRNLSYKLLRAKSKLEAVSAAEEKAKSIVSNEKKQLTSDDGVGVILRRKAARELRLGFHDSDGGGSLNL